MTRTCVPDTVECAVFRDFVYHYQANELLEADRGKLQQHLDSCECCARYLEVEESFARALRLRLSRIEAPEGLHARLKEALNGLRPAPARRWTWLFSPLAAVAAASILVIALLVSSRVGSRAGARAGNAVHVVRAAMIVDEDCDRAGFPIGHQRRCRKASHLNALKLADGTYWTLGLGEREAREILVDVTQRGRRVVVEGDLYPAIRTLRITGLRDES